MLVNPVNQKADIALDDIQRQRQRERAAYHYFRAMEEGDLDTVVLMLERAESDPVLEHMLLDLDAHLVEEAEERERAGSRSPLADPPAPTQPMLALLAPETMGDAGQTRAESCVS
jgi:hypothetical protein